MHTPQVCHCKGWQTPLEDFLFKTLSREENNHTENPTSLLSNVIFLLCNFPHLLLLLSTNTSFVSHLHLPSLFFSLDYLSFSFFYPIFHLLCGLHWLWRRFNPAGGSKDQFLIQKMMSSSIWIMGKKLRQQDLLWYCNTLDCRWFAWLLIPLFLAWVTFMTLTFITFAFGCFCVSFLFLLSLLLSLCLCMCRISGLFFNRSLQVLLWPLGLAETYVCNIHTYNKDVQHTHNQDKRHGDTYPMHKNKTVSQQMKKKKIKVE